MPLADLPEPPYVAVIFTSERTDEDEEGYGAMAMAMAELASMQPGYLGVESTRDMTSGVGITVSYWTDEAAALAWKHVAEHEEAQRFGRERWYRGYRLRVASVTRGYGFDA
jgi:heme-degrading monooxygenase HmoA